MRIVTALHPERRDRVRVDLDGEPWRTLPATAVVSAGLRVGGALDRERARELGRSLRRIEALDAAGKALSHRDRSTAELEARLEQRGVRPSDRAAAVETMARLGYVDDGRMAADRARNMASRGFGDEAIRFDLEGRGIDTELIASAIEPAACRRPNAPGRSSPGASPTSRLPGALRQRASRPRRSRPPSPSGRTRRAVPFTVQPANGRRTMGPRRT